MDPERQPLLGHGLDARRRRYRPLTYEEVLTARQEVTWRRARFFLIIMFWAIIAMFISIITCILISAPRCNSDTGLSMSMIPTVPPVHLTFTPLMLSGRSNDEHVYAM